MLIHSIFPFSDEQVRVLLFRECDWSGRRLLFDSNAVKKMNDCSTDQSTTSKNQNANLSNSTNRNGTNSSKTFIEICNGYGYVYDHTMSESNNIGEMVFGSAAMSFKGTSLKVNNMQKLNFKLIKKRIISLMFLGSLDARTNTNTVFTSFFISNLSKK